MTYSVELYMMCNRTPERGSEKDSEKTEIFGNNELKKINLFNHLLPWESSL